MNGETRSPTISTSSCGARTGFRQLQLRRSQILVANSVASLAIRKLLLRSLASMKPVSGVAVCYHEYFLLTRQVERSRSYGIFATTRRTRVALYLGDIATIEMSDDQEDVFRHAMPHKENEDLEPRPSLPAEAGGKDRTQRTHTMVAVAALPRCGKSS